MNQYGIKKTQYKADINDLLRTAELDNSYIYMIGSASLLISKYYGDLDFACIYEKRDATKMYNDLMGVIEKIKNNDDLRYIELKIQKKDGDKVKFGAHDKIDLSTFKKNTNVDYYKIDIIGYIHKRFTEISINYHPKTKITKDTLDKNVINIKKDIKEYAEEGNYLKSLKRSFTISVIEKDNEKARVLVDYLNSPIMAKYMIKSELEAIKLLNENYTDDITRNRIRERLKYLKISNVDDAISRLNKVVQNSAKKIYDKLE
jgi:hypothetical protein